MLYLNGSPSATDNTSGISLLPEIYNQKFKETTAMQIFKVRLIY
jgi:outer membrane receptor for ferric coprogen and ferric-rhodotorulic acid